MILRYLVLNECIFSDWLIHTFLFSLAPLWSKTDVFLFTALLYLIYSWELWFLQCGVLIQLVGFCVHMVHCGIVLSDLLHVKIPFEDLFFHFCLFFSSFFLLWESKNPFHAKNAAYLWTSWLIRIFWTQCTFSIFSSKISLSQPSAYILSFNAPVCPKIIRIIRIFLKSHVTALRRTCLQCNLQTRVIKMLACSTLAYRSICRHEDKWMPICVTRHVSLFVMPNREKMFGFPVTCSTGSVLFFCFFFFTTERYWL